MSHSHEIRRLANHLRVFLNMLSRYLSYPLRLVHRLFHSLLQKYSHVASTRLQRIHRDEPAGQVAGSALPQFNNQLQIPTPSVPPFNSSSLPILPFPTAPPSSNHAQQPSSASPGPVESTEFQPFTPSEVIRYDKKPTTEPIHLSPTINPLTRDYTDVHCGGNWSARVHPEGALYFYEDVRGVYSDSDLQSSERRGKIDLCITALFKLAVDVTCGVDIQLVVQLLRNRGTRAQICRYYFVDHRKRLLFWVHDQHTEKLFDGVRGVEKMSHIKYAIEHQYWSHCEMYPNERLPGSALLNDLKEIVVHASAETITTDLSLSPFDGDELTKILDLIGQLQENVHGGYEAHSLCVIARFMRYFTRAKFFNFCGLLTARLDADQSVYIKKERGKLLVALSWAFNVALFGAPDSHMRELRRVWVDRSINSPRWKQFNNQLASEWSGITMYSTVMLAVDVSFLAVPSVMPSVTPPATSSDTQTLPLQVISTYISMFCIVGSLVVSLFLTRQNRHQESADKAVEFLTKTTGSAFGTKALATVHGLPYAMLLWGMVYFMLGFSYQVFTSASTITLATTGSAFGLVVVFALWLIHAARDFHMSTRLLAWLRARLSRAKQTGP
ncbi:hypothetical protein M405DRAFT_785153 [Rhizopogon salebrosus TDB-379]|nr:hypothetical protein M405DRAFT_785153 [Rhizopogon salebrosus TDB-379]